MNQILATVVIPVFNQERFISRAIESAISQTCLSYFRLLVVDDGSTDNTSSILQQYIPEIDVIHQGNGGTSAAWNTAIHRVGSEFLIGLDSDDEFYPTTVEAVIAKALAVPDASVVYSDYEFIDSGGNSIKQVRNPEPYNPIAQLIQLHDRLGEPDNFLPFGHVRLYRRSALLAIGGYDLTYRYAEDFDLVLRLAESDHRFVRVPEILYRYRWHNTNKGIVTRQEQIEDVRRAVVAHRERSSHK